MARNYKKEYERYHSKKKAKKQRARNNASNREKGTYGNRDGKDVAHSQPGARGRTHLQSPNTNRSFPRTRHAGRKR